MVYGKKAYFVDSLCNEGLFLVRFYNYRIAVYKNHHWYIMTKNPHAFRSSNPDSLISGTPNKEEPRKIKGWFLIIVISLFIGLSGSIIGGAWYFFTEMAKSLPTFEQLQNIKPPLVSRVYAADSSLIHEFSIERRFWVPLEKIPQDLIHALISIEDRRFYTHWGIDIRRIMGAIAVDIMRGHYAQGASTLTQQLARNLYLTSRQSLERKIREAMTALQLESHYTKDEIIELYLNQVYLGGGVYGVEAASQKYFSKSVSDLTLNECAVLAGVIQLPEYYRPDKEKNHPRTKRRRRQVLQAMTAMNFLSPAQARDVMADTIPNNPAKARSKIAPYFVEQVRLELSKMFGDETLYNEGLTIHTTLDPFAQDSAEKALASHLATLQQSSNRLFADSIQAYGAFKMSRQAYLESFDSIYAANEDRYSRLPDSLKLRIIQGSVVGMETHTGAVKVLIGGRDFDESKFNRAIQARRQPGSAMKPIVYTAAIDSGFTPATVILDQPITLQTDEGVWQPENYGRKFYGPVPLRKALAKSINLVAIQVLQQIGARKVVDYARRLGFEHRINAVPSLAIGACEVTPMEIARAYGVFPNAGVLVKPYFITQVLDENNRVVYEHSPEDEEVIPPSTAFIMADMLKDVVLRGTGASVYSSGFHRPCGGKTGTTNDYSDAWFVGFTPQMVCAVWVGVDERRSMGYGITGSRGAIPIWVGTMKALHDTLPSEDFEKPEDVLEVTVCNVTNKLARKYCPQTRTEYIVEKSIIDTCDKHILIRERKRQDVDFHHMFDANPDRSRDRKKKKRKQLLF